MSTRSSLWYGEDEGKAVHIYYELADRDVALGAAPVCIAVESHGEEVVTRLPKAVAEPLIKLLDPNPDWKLL